MKPSKKDIELRIEFFHSLKEQYLKGKISKSEFDSYILRELKLLSEDCEELEIRIPKNFDL